MKNLTNILQNIFSKTGDSELQQFRYENNELSLEVKLSDDDSILKMTFKTDYIYKKEIANVIPFNIGYFKLIRLSEVLPIENNHYMFKGSFVDIMKAQRSKYNLAFGLNVKDYTHLIIFINSSISLAFIINENDEFNSNFVEA